MGGAVAGVGGKIATLVAGIGSAAILARLLTPHEYGLFGLITICQATSQLVPQSISTAMIRQKDAGPEDVGAGVTLILLTGIFMAGVLVLLRHVVSSFFDAELARPLLFLAAILPLVSLTAYFDGLLARTFEFKKNALFSFLSTVLGQTLVSVVLAYLGFGVWALLYGMAAAGVVRLGLQLSTGTWRRLTPGRVSLRLASQSGSIFLLNVWNYLGRNADNMIVGKVLGTDSLGIYQRAYTLMMRPVDLFGGVTTSVFFPLMASIQSDVPRLKSAYTRGFALASLLGLPTSAFLSVHAGEVIELLYGPRWIGVIAPFRVLALGLYFRLGYRISDVTLLSMGALRAVNLLQFLYAALVILGAFIGSRWGLTAVSAGVALALSGFFLASAGYANRRLEVSTRDFAMVHIPGAMIAAFALPPTLLLRARVSAVAGPFGVLVMGGLAVLAGFALVLFYRKTLVREPSALATLDEVHVRVRAQLTKDRRR